jgi:branched-chain amino acid transport system ATP-binding protein
MTRQLEIQSISVQRGPRLVLQEISLTVMPGRVTALLGANGAGKSSLVLTIAGALKPVSGRIRVDGRDLTGQRPEIVRAAGVAAVPEGHHILTDLSVVENLIAAGSRLKTSDLASAQADALAIFPELGERLGQRAGTMSGGQQQMLAIAQALMARPKYLLFDELSLGLAPLIVKRLSAVVEQIARSGIGVLLIEQFTTVALKLADQVAVLDRGALCFSGTPAELAASPSVLHDAYLAGTFEA